MKEGGRGGRRLTRGSRACGSSSGKPKGSWEKGRDTLVLWGWLSAAFGVFMSQCMGIGRVVKEKWPSSSPFNWSGECGRRLGLFLPLSLPHATAELGFPGVWLFLRGPSPDEPPPTGLEKTCQPVTMREPPSLKKGEEKGVGDTRRKLCCLL